MRLRKTRALGLDIEYAQADIMRLGTLRATFDLIESSRRAASPGRSLCGMARAAFAVASGRLHADRALQRDRALGRGGRARVIAQRRLWRDAAEIRRFRQRPDATRRQARRAEVMRFNDFYSTSECRDLLFHTQEHRMTLPAIKTISRRAELPFLGMEVDRVTARQYATHFPNDPAMTDLDNWDAFERRIRRRSTPCIASGCSRRRAELRPDLPGRPHPPWSRSRCR